MSYVVTSIEERVDQALAMNAVQEAHQLASSGVAQQASHWAAHHRLGLVLARLNRLHEAFGSFNEALKLNPLSSEVRIALANAYLAMNDGWTAAAWVSDACRVQPNNAAQWLQLAQLLGAQKRVSEIEPAIRSALGACPDSIELLAALSEFYINQKRHHDALVVLERLELVRPGNARTALHKGFAFEHTFQLKESIAWYRKALEREPNFFEAEVDLAGVLWRMGDFAGTLKHAKRAHELQPDHPFALRILGTAYLHYNQFDQAEALIRQALVVQPKFPVATIDLSLLLLLAGKFEDGWATYQLRWNDTDRMVRPSFFRPDLEWQGPERQSVNGKRVLIYAEQGLGDVINFIRYAQVLQADGATVYAVVQPDLIPIVETMPGVICLKPNVNLEADYHVALLELPLHYKSDPVREPDLIPRAVPYLHAPSSKVDHWRARLAPWAGQFKIGITWSGHHIHANHHNRCMPLSHFLPLMAIDGVQCFSLQKSGGGDYTDCQVTPEQLVDFTADFTDFTDTAAMVEQLDLLVCIDSAVVHLAGALGKPVWVPLPPNPDWRWLTERDDSPWYPTMRLFRRGHDEAKLEQMARLIEAVRQRVDALT